MCIRDRALGKLVVDLLLHCIWDFAVLVGGSIEGILPVRYEGEASLGEGSRHNNKATKTLSLEGTCQLMKLFSIHYSAFIYISNAFLRIW